MSKVPKLKENPPYRNPTHIQDPFSYDKRHIRFRFDLLDFDHHLWGWENLIQKQHLEILRFFHGIEKQTWAELKSAAEGRNHGTNHHSLEISKFDKKAKKRILELNLEKIVEDTLFSLRVNNCTRIYGVREAEFFRPIWHDPHHDQPDKAAYPCNRK